MGQDESFVSGEGLMGLDIVHNHVTTLSAPHLVGSDTLMVVDGAGFGNPTTDNPVRITCERATDSARVIFHATARSGNTLSGLTAIEGTNDIGLAAGDKVEERDTAGRWNDIHEAIDALQMAIDGALDDLYGGVAGGQILTGGTAAGDDLTLRSTANATKGKIIFGGSAYDENLDRLGIGTQDPAYAIHLQATGTEIGYGVQNIDDTGTSFTQWIAAGGQFAEAAMSGASAFGNFVGLPTALLFYLQANANNMMIRLNGSGVLALVTGSSQRLRIDSAGIVDFPAGKLRLPRMADATAPNDTWYYSTDRSAPTYKDDGGGYHSMY